MTDYQHENAPELGVEELELAQGLINDIGPGEYTAKEIYVEFWDENTARAFGKRFKRAVESGQLKSISWIERNTNNAAVYRVRVHGKSG